LGGKPPLLLEQSYCLSSDRLFAGKATRRGCTALGFEARKKVGPPSKGQQSQEKPNSESSIRDGGNCTNRQKASPSDDPEAKAISSQESSANRGKTLARHTRRKYHEACAADSLVAGGKTGQKCSKNSPREGGGEEDGVKNRKAQPKMGIEVKEPQKGAVSWAASKPTPLSQESLLSRI